MTSHEFAELAREAGLEPYYDAQQGAIERFACLVEERARAQERAAIRDQSLISSLEEILSSPGCERLREWCAVGPVQRAAFEEAVTLLAAQTAAAERERLAWTQDHWTEYEHNIAAAERKRVVEEMQSQIKSAEERGAAAEREAFREHALSLAREAIRTAVDREREACANVVAELAKSLPYPSIGHAVAIQAIAAIKARQAIHD